MSERLLTLTLSADTLQRLTAAAGGAGVSVDILAARIVEQALSPDGLAEDAAVFRSGHDWTEADRRLADYDRTGESLDALTTLDAFVASVDARAAARR